MVFMVSFSGLGIAAGDLPDTFVMMPIRTIAVKGDAAKFRALNWMNDGNTGGIKEMTVERNLGKGTSVSFEGHAIPGDNDLGADLTLTKDNGYMKLEYGNFRKWYDNVGGSYPPYSTLKVNSLDNSDLHLDLGHFLMELGSGPSDDPTLSLTYERDTKTGIKSRLSWATVSDTVGSTVTSKKIAPSWESMDEATDTLTLRGKAEAMGFALKGQGSYEFFDGRTFREYKALFSSAGTTQNITRQDSQPQTKVLSSIVRAERWSLNDHNYISLAYRFGHTKSSEIFNSRSYTYANVPTGTTVNKDAYGRTFEDTHTWTGQLMSNLTDDLNFTVKAKAEVISRRSSGDDMTASSVTATTITWNPNTLNANTVEDKIIRTGETVALRYNGIPKTSLYTEIDLGQERNWLSENRAQITTPVNREEIANNPSYVETVGVRVVPTRWVNMTTNYKHTAQDQKFNTLYKSSAIALDRNSFYNKMQIDVNEIASRATWKPFKWLENSLRYKTAEKKYHTQAVGQDWEKSQGSERNYVYDITLIPTDALMFNLSYSRQDLKTSTPGSAFPDIGTTSVGIPVFTANVYSWMFSTGYAPLDNFSIFNTVEFSRAKNANYSYATASSFRYGVDDEWWDMTYGLRWVPKKDITVEPHYAYYSFRANQSVETGNYSAHAMWLDVKYNW